MIEHGHNAEILSNDSFVVPLGRSGFRRALLVNPPVYDAQYWARWSQPAGLLRIATYLGKQGYAIDLIDCMEANAKGMVPKRALRGPDGEVLPPRSLDDITKTIWHFGLTWDEFRARTAALETPDEVWITSVMTYWWESTRDAVNLVREVFPSARVVVGGIYPTLAPHHAQEHLGADVVFEGELSA